jgi:histidyl-tRNA synthetase
LIVEMLSPERKLKTLLARASKIGARFAVIIGDDEIARGVVQLRDLKNSTQLEVTVAEAPRAIADARSK